MDVIAAGLVVEDIIASPVDRSVFDKDSVRIGPVMYRTGGDAFNVACNLKKMGLDVCIAGVVGGDMSGDHIRQKAADLCINTEKLVVSEKNPTSTSIVLCEKNGERHFAYNGAANDEFDGSSLTDGFLRRARLLYIGSSMALGGLDGENLAKLFKRAKRAGLTTSMDAACDDEGLWYEKIKDALPYTDIFIPSYDEAVNITGENDAKGIARFLRSKGVRIAGVKLGKAGCYIEKGDEKYRMSAYAADDAVDTTGAGDAFMSGFICGVLRNMSIYDCARLGSASANFCIRQFGATSNTRSFEETLEYINSNKIYMITEE
jgi:ribokinase